MRTILVLVFLAPLTTFLTSQAATIQYSATDLADVTPGENLWRYDYVVSGHSFLQLEFFDIYFVPSLYGTLTAGPSPSADWDVAILQQPNPANPPPFDRGFFDAFALNDLPSLSGTFSVDFVYLGAGTPGAQPFEIFAANSDLVESGSTTPLSDVAIPEPSTAALFLIGLAACAIRIHRRSNLRR